MRISFWCLSMLLLLAACNPAVGPSNQIKLGKPYAIDGHTYYPAYDPTYDKIGEASWYGPGFHGKYTASGETYNQNDLTAAHPTLPMPSLVRVTNLKNGKSVIVRINDRGPFKSNRIIDLSKKAATQIGLLSTGPVRVQYLKAETEEYIAQLQDGDKPAEMKQLNAQAEQLKTDSVVASTAPPGSGQIVETTDSSTHAGQIVASAAPVMTVSSGDLGGSSEGTSNLTDKSGHLVHTGTLVKEVWADDNVSLPQPPAETAKKFDPPPVKDKPVAESKEEEKADAQTPEKKPAQGASAKGRFIIQVGSFAAEGNARKLTSKLEGIAPVAIDKIEMGDKTWWRVRVGPFAQREEADGALAQVRDAGLPEARVVRL